MAKVYSTEFGQLCKQCGQPQHNGKCQLDSERIVGNGKVRIHRETKGRKGAGVTLVEGLPLTMSDLKALHKTLKKQCGVGGAVKNGILEFQGDHREKLLGLITGLDEASTWDIKLSGG